MNDAVIQDRDLRFAVPLYTVTEAARYVRVPRSTLHAWARGYDRVFDARAAVHGDAVITAFDTGRAQPSIPFIGLAEALVLAAFRKTGVSLQHIRHALPILEREVGLEHALASRRLYTDGAAILYDFAHRPVATDHIAVELSGLTRVVDGQRVFAEVVGDYLRRITYAEDGWAAQLVGRPDSRWKNHASSA